MRHRGHRGTIDRRPACAADTEREALAFHPRPTDADARLERRDRFRAGGACAQAAKQLAPVSVPRGMPLARAAVPTGGVHRDDGCQEGSPRRSRRPAVSSKPPRASGAAATAASGSRIWNVEPTDAVVDGDRTADQVEQPRHDVQPQPDAALLSHQRALACRKGSKISLEALRWDVAGVADVDHDVAASSARDDRHAAVCGELERVHHQVLPARP